MRQQLHGRPGVNGANHCPPWRSWPGSRPRRKRWRSKGSGHTGAKARTIQAKLLNHAWTRTPNTYRPQRPTAEERLTETRWRRKTATPVQKKTSAMGPFRISEKYFSDMSFPDVVYSTCENLIIQGAIKLNRGGHEVYVDDSLLVLQGTLWRSKQHLGFHSQHNGLVGHQAEPG